MSSVFLDLQSNRLTPAGGVFPHRTSLQGNGLPVLRRNPGIEAHPKLRLGLFRGVAKNLWRFRFSGAPFSGHFRMPLRYGRRVYLLANQIHPEEILAKCPSWVRKPPGILARPSGEHRPRHTVVAETIDRASAHTVLASCAHLPFASQANSTRAKFCSEAKSIFAGANLSER